MVEYKNTILTVSSLRIYPFKDVQMAPFLKSDTSSSRGKLPKATDSASDWNYAVGVESRAVVETTRGHRMIGELRQGQDEVLTLDHGFQPILWKNEQFLNKGRCVQINKGAMGNCEEIQVAPDQCIFLSGQVISILFAVNEVLCPISSLIDGKNIFFKDNCTLTFVQIVFHHHELIRVGSLAYGSFFIDDNELSGLSHDSFKRLVKALPRIESSHKEYGSTARMRLKYDEGRVLNEYLQKDVYSGIPT